MILKKRTLVIVTILFFFMCCVNCVIGRHTPQYPETEIRGILQFTLSELRLLSGTFSYVIREDSDTRYNCPKPLEKIAYITIGQEPHVIAYFPIGKNYLYTVKGWVDDTTPEGKIIHASFIGWTKK